MLQSRRQLLGSLLAGITVVGGVAAGVRTSSRVQMPAWGEGSPSDLIELKVGSLDLTPVTNHSETPVANDLETSAADEGAIPVAIRIPDAEVNAQVERTKIVDGLMLDPSGPWVVSWYETTGLVGERDNAVMSGHVDYWDVGPAVFQNVASLPDGAAIQVDGLDGTTYSYAVESIQRVPAKLDQEKVSEIVGPTDYAALTLITCGGEFDFEIGEYPQRDIVRARLTGTSEGEIQITGQEQVIESPTDQSAVYGSPDGGTLATVTEELINIRADATTNADVVGEATVGQTVTIIGGPQEGDGYIWVEVRLEDGTEGWIVQGFLAPAK
jgi:sortase (surface protein transpeptidase)